MTDETYQEDNYEPDDGEKTLADWIDEWLTDERPERYERDDRDWIERVFEKAVKMNREQDIDEIIERDARRQVTRREAEASRQVNKALRSIAESEQLPIWWADDPAWTITYAKYLHLPVSIGKLKVQFRAMGVDDWEHFVIEHKRQEDEVNAAREMTRNGAVLIASWMQQQNARRTEDIRPQGN